MISQLNTAITSEAIGTAFVAFKKDFKNKQKLPILIIPAKASNTYPNRKDQPKTGFIKGTELTKQQLIPIKYYLDCKASASNNSIYCAIYSYCYYKNKHK